MNVLRYIQNHANEILLIFNYQYMYMHDSKTKTKRIIALKNAEKLYIFPGGIYGQNDKNSINSRVSSTVTDRRRGESTRVGLVNWECWDLRSNIMMTAFNHQELNKFMCGARFLSRKM